MSNDLVDESQVVWDDDNSSDAAPSSGAIDASQVVWDDEPQSNPLSGRLESMHKASTDTPEDVAKWDGLAKQAGVSYNVAKTIPDQVEKKLNPTDWDGFAADAPKTAQFLSDNPRVFEKAKGDIQALRDIEKARIEKARTVGSFAHDLGIRAIQGVSLAGQSVIGTTDMALKLSNPIKAAVDLALDRESGTLSGLLSDAGISFNKANEAADALVSDASKQDSADVKAAFDDGLVSGGMALVERLPFIAEKVVQSAPQMLVAMAAVRQRASQILAEGGEAALKAAMPELAKLSAAIEGAQTAGNYAGEKAEDGDLTARESLAAAGQFVTTAAIGQLSNKIGGLFGIDDVEAAVASGIKNNFSSVTDYLSKLGGTLIKEGPIEEGMQSATEQGLANFGDGKDLLQGTGRAFVEGSVVGAAQGGTLMTAKSGVDAVSNLLRKTQESADRTANDVNALGAQIDAIAKIKLAQLDKEDAVSVLNNMDGGEIGYVYVDSALFHTGVVTKDVFLKAVPSAADQIDQAMETGGLIRVPRNELLVGVSQNADIRNDVMAHVKSDVFGDTQSELGARQSELDKELEEVANKAISMAKDKEKAADDFKEAADHIASQLDATGYGTKEGNKTRAILIASRASVIAFNKGIKPIDVIKKHMGRFRYDPTNKTWKSGAYNQYAGEQAQGADLTALQRAKQAVDSGADPEQTRQETGWHKWEDGKWRFEIDDSQAKQKLFSDKGYFGEQFNRHVLNEGDKPDGYSSLKVGDILDHSALFDAYPNLADIRIVPEKGTGASFSSGQGDPVIGIGTDKPMKDVKSAILHEIQHAIQEQEGFARGGSAKSFYRPGERNKHIEDLFQKYKADEYSKKYTDDELYQKAERVVDSQPFREKAYRRLAGEIEARDTQARAGMSAEERKQNKPYISQGIPDDQVIVRKGGDGVRFNHKDIDNSAGNKASIDTQPDQGVHSNGEVTNHANSSIYAANRAEIESGIEQWTQAFNLDGRGSYGVVPQQWAKPSAYSNVSRGEGSFLTEESSPETIRDESNKLIAAAKENGFFWENDSPVFDQLADAARPTEAGAEHDAYFVGSGDDRLVIRSTANGTYGPTKDTSPAQYLQRLEENNIVFPYLPIEVIAVSQDEDGNAVIWTAQKFADGKEFDSEKELESAMAKHGWEREGVSYRYKHKETGAVIQDAHTGNVLYNGDDLYPIDVIVEKLPNKDVLFQSEKAKPFDGKEVAATKLPEGTTHIDVDGVSRPALNSDGKPIHWSEEGTRNFWRWFGDSKVVDAEGRPLVVYHGTKNKFSVFDYGKIGTQGRAEGSGFYLTENRDLASGYGEPMELYLKMEKPLSYDAKPFKKAQLQKIIKRVADIEAKHNGEPVADGFLSNFGDVRYEGITAVMREAVESMAEEGSAIDQIGGMLGAGASAEHVNLAVKEITGFDGVIAKGFSNLGVRESGAPTIYVAALNTQIKSATDNSGAFDGSNPNIFKQNDTSPRGFFHPPTRDITMLAKVDLSTFLHEVGHLFLEIQAELAMSEHATDRMKSDMDTVLKWFGVKGENASERLAAWNAMTLEEKRKFHEKYAESFEQYLFEGKAPSVELEETFQTFRAWLSYVYTSIKNFLSESGQNADLNDEIRAVFDRMLATEEQIAQAQQTAGMMPMYASRPEGVSDAEWEAYQQAADEYVQAATEQLSSRALRDLKWVKNAVGTKGKIMREMRGESAALRREARMEATTRFLSRPIVQAYQFLTAPVEGVKARNKRARSSEHVDTARDSLFTAIAKLGGLNKEEAVSQYGIDPKDFLRKGGVFGKPVLRVDGGLSPDAMAEALSQHNYLPLDEHGKWDIRDLEDLLREEAAGNPQYSTDVDMDVLLGEPQRAFFDAENVEYMGGRLNRIDIRNMFDDIQLAEMAGIDPFTGEKVADMSGQLQQPAFHGSPYKFDKFSLEHIGKGEGAQAYGWGLYFAGNKEVAEYYRETLAIGKGGNNFRQMAVDALAAEGVSVDDDSALTVFQRFAMEMTGKGGKPASYARKVQNASAPMRAYDTAAIGRALQTYVEAENKGQLYKVEIPEDDTYLLWDKPLIAQSEKVKAALRSMDNRVTFGKDRESVKQWIKITGDIPPEMRAMTGRALYSHIAGKLNARHDSPKTGSQQASEYLHSIGIRGIKYLDGSSRGAGDGNYNYVIFDGSAVKILETYYQLGDKDQPQSRTLESMGVLSDDGILPELVAGYFGMETEQLIRGLLDTPELGNIKQAIENMTDQIMLERHADLATPEAIAEAALKAVMNKARAKFVATEYAILAKATGSERVLQRQAKDYAGRVIGETKVKDVKPEKFIAAAAKAGKEAQKAMAKSDTKAALLAKRNQVLNEATAKLAVDVKEEIDKFDDLAAKIIKATNEKNAKRGRDPDVVNAITAVMGFYGFYPSRQQNAMEYLERVREHDPDMFLRLQDAVNRAAVNQKDFNDLTINEMRGLREEIEGLWYTAKRSRQMEIDGKKIDLQEAADGLVTRLLEVGLPDEKLGAKNAPTEKDLLTHKLKTAGAWLTRVEQWAERMDGQWGGAFTRYIFQPVKKAADRYRTEATEYNRRYVALIDALPKMKRGLIAAPELGYTFGAGDQKVGMAELLHAVLHTGNASNKRKLLLGRGWAVLREDGSLDTARWDMFVQRMYKQGVLKKEHYDFAQGVWDLLEDTKAGAQKTHRDVFGYYFAEVTADAFDTPFGSYRGGYVPAQADPRLVVDAAQRAMAEEENNTLVNAFPATAKGFTKGRTEYNKPLMLDLQSLAQHINKVLLFTHMEPAVRDVKKLLMRNDVAETLGAVDRAAYDSMLTPWLSVAARQSVNTPVTGDAGISNAVNIARNNTGMALMAANLSNAMQQITGFLTATQKVKGKYILRETASFLARPKEYANEVRAASEYMAVRMDAEIHAINSQLNELLIAPTAYQKTKAFAARHAYFLQAMMDNTISPIIWRATFNQSVEKGMTDADAEQYANATIRQTQGSSLPEDVSRVEVGGAFWRATMQFYGYFNSMLNTNVVAVKNAKTKTEAMGHIIYGAILPAIVAQSIAVAMRGGVDDDDYDGWLDDWITEVAGTGLFRYATAMVPVVGAFANLAVGYTTKTPVDDRMQTSATTSMIGSALRAVDSVPDAITGDGKPSKAIKDVAAGVSLFTGLPIFALARPVGYAADVAAGEVSPTSVADTVRGMLTGTASPGSK